MTDAPACSPSTTAIAVKPLRIRHVDSLRAIAAGLVVWTHFAETLLPLSGHNPGFLAFLHIIPPKLQFGRLGVDLFFIVSGFVISRSFGGPPEGSSRRFLIRRVCRLYPAFWVSMLAGILIWQLEGRAMTWPMLAANATMAPQSLGQPRLIGLYWTLRIELGFYGLCLLLHWFRGLENRAVLAWCALTACALPRALSATGDFFGADWYLSGDFGLWMMSLALMLWGAFFRSVYEETGGFRRSPFRCRGTWFLLLLAVVMIEVFDPMLNTILLHQPVDLWWERLVTPIAVAVFTLWVALLRIDTRILTFLGTISYSLYLFHPLVLSLFTVSLRAFDSGSRPGLPLWLYLVAGSVLTTALATLVYRRVEHPAIAFGKRWAEHRHSPTKADPRSENPVGQHLSGVERL